MVCLLFNLRTSLEATNYFMIIALIAVYNPLNRINRIMSGNTKRKK